MLIEQVKPNMKCHCDEEVIFAPVFKFKYWSSWFSHIRIEVMLMLCVDCSTRIYIHVLCWSSTHHVHVLCWSTTTTQESCSNLPLRRAYFIRWQKRACSLFLSPFPFSAPLSTHHPSYPIPHLPTPPYILLAQPLTPLPFTLFLYKKENIIIK